MKKVFTTFLLFVSVLCFAQGEIQDKAHSLALAYQTATSATTVQTQTAEAQLVSYFTLQANGSTVPLLLQSQVNAILGALSSGSALGATNVNFTVGGALDSSDPTYNRVAGASFNAGCITQGSLSGTGTAVYYDVIEFTVTSSGNFDIEVVSFPDDSYLALYCSFDPLNPTANLIDTDDDGGSGLLSLLENMPLSAGTYYLVMHTFGNGDSGAYSIEFRSDNGHAVLGSAAVPINYWWIGGLFLLVGIGIVVKRFFF